MHQVTDCPLVCHPPLVARGRLAQPSTQEGGCASSVAHPTPPPMCPCSGAPCVPPTLNPQPTHLALTPGEGWTQHSHAAPWAHRGVEETPVLSTAPAALSHSQARCLQSPISIPSLHCSWDLPGGSEPLRTPKPLELGLCSTHEPLTTLGTPLCSFGASAIARGHIQPPNHSLEGLVQAELGANLLLQFLAGGFWPGHVQHQAKPHLPGPWASPGVPMALQHHPWLGRVGAGQSQVLRGPGALLPRGAGC